MKSRELIEAALLLVAGGLVAFGAAAINTGAGLIVGGVLFAGWTFLVFAEGRA